MNFQQLAKFIRSDMRMAHVYQPVMLMALLRRGGRLSAVEIAKALLQGDESQIEYYTQITNNMVGKVLKKRGVVEKEDGDYTLLGFNALKRREIDELMRFCKARLDEYLAKRGDAVWSHRRKSAGYVSGTVKYEVLKAARFHCTLCGISADRRALEVDHITPRSKGGRNEVSNYQALCYSCNAMKRDRDDTDFRERFYERRERGCLFCEIPTARVIAENDLAYVVQDGFPVTPLHALVVPKRHVATYFDLRPSEVSQCNTLLAKAKSEVERKDPEITAFNIGMNCGEIAGQSVFHCHIHLIPRRKGDHPNPRGGVRHIIPGKGNY